MLTGIQKTRHCSWVGSSSSSFILLTWGFSLSLL
jgi:hypothetical protein